MSTSANFFRDLSVLEDFSEITDPRHYTEAPADWFVIISDIQGSTVAIREGRYKAVNSVGAAAIISVLNALKGSEVPYCFGGDGATLLVPPASKDAALKALAATKMMASDSFGLTLRVGCVPIATVQKEGFSVGVAKFKTSANIRQAAFSGGGIAHAEALIKAPGEDNPYRLDALVEPGSEFEGLECRWSPLKHRNGEIVSLVIKASAKDSATAARTYREALDLIQEIYGSTDHLSPAHDSNLKTTMSPRRLAVEARLRTHGAGEFLKYLSRIWIYNLLWLWIFHKRLVAFGIDWGRYKDEVVLNSDYRKFDDTLRMVIDGSPEQRARLQHELEARSNRGELVYGLWASETALITCLIFDRDGNHVHLIDGNDGGYALAAVQMKEQLKKQTAKSG